MSKLKLDSVVQRNPDQLSAGMDGETVMMNVDSSAYFGLNTVGTEVWEAIEQPTTIESVCKKVVEKFDIDQQSCETDILELLTELLESNIILRTE